MPQQLKHLLIVFAVLAGGLVAARRFLTPKTFGEKGHYRTAALEAILKQPVRYAGREACAMCHPDIVEAHGKARHQTVSCEVCHGPAAAHIEAPTENRLPAPRERGYCPLCHGYDPSRPTGFPQINPTVHNPLKPCITCHNPHDPVPRTVPQACSACHAQIQRTTSVSSHALLRCTTCHQVPARHKQAPRSALPSKPDTREFCGKCHGKGSTVMKEAPQVDLATHGGSYLCWQCHYPHLPEGRG